MMYFVTVKAYLRHTMSDRRYTIETLWFNTQEKMLKWKKDHCDGWHVELVSYGYREYSNCYY